MPAAKRTRAAEAPATEPERASKRSRPAKEPEKAPAKPAAKKGTAAQTAAKTTKVTKAKSESATSKPAVKKVAPKAAAKKESAPKKAAPRARAVSKAPSVQPPEEVEVDKYAAPDLKPLKDTAVINPLRYTEPVDVFVCGEGRNGELGLGTLNKETNVKRPRYNAKLESMNIVRLAAGGMHAVAITKDNKIVTWGINDQATLGRDTRWEGGTKDIDDNESTDEEEEAGDEESGMNPREANAFEIPSDRFHDNAVFVDVCAGDSCSFALTDQGRVYGWGTFRSNEGILGFTPKIEIAWQPVLLDGLKNIVKICCGNNHALALDNKGKMFVWGAAQQHQLARQVVQRGERAATHPNSLSIKEGRKILKIKDINCGTFHNFAITEDDRVFSWGLNNFGQTGIFQGLNAEGTNLVKTPTEVEVLPTSLRALQGGGHHSFAINAKGEVLIWGRCDGCQTGIDLETIPRDNLVFQDVENNPTPPLKFVKILKVPTVVSAIKEPAVSGDAGQDHNLIITENGKAYSWGFSVNYQTGQGPGDDVKTATLIANSATKDRKLIWAGAGGQYSAFAAKRQTTTNGIK